MKPRSENPDLGTRLVVLRGAIRQGFELFMEVSSVEYTLQYVMTIHADSSWKLCVGILALLGFAALGIAHVVFPDYFLRRSAIRRGGEMLNAWNRTGFQIVGLLIFLFSAGGLYEIVTDALSR